MPYRDPADEVKCKARLYREHTDYINRLKDRPCTDCGATYPYYVMEFDHIEPKSFTLAAAGNRSIAAIDREFAKCEVVCGNCHNVRTYKRRLAGRLLEARDLS